MNTKNYTLLGDFKRILSSGLPFLVLTFFSLSLKAEVLTLTCPEDLTVELAPGECNAIVHFDTLVWTSTQVLTDTVFFPPSGSTFETGNNTVTLAVTDVDGDLEVCTFNVQVNEFFPEELLCEQNVEISLNGLCSRTIFASEFLSMDSTGCVDNYEVTRLTSSGVALPPIINASDINSSFLVLVSHSETGIQCLTQVTITGGTPPSFSCPENAVISCNEPLDTSITGFPILDGCFQNVEFDFSDIRTNTSCPDSVAFQVVRTWVGTDPFGQQDVCEQLITAFRFDISLVDFPNDFNGIINPPLQCVDSLTLAELTDPSVTGEPTFINFSAAAEPDCRVTSTYNDKLTNICGGSFDIERAWTVVNLCEPTATRRDTQYISVIDTLGPEFDLDDSILVSLSNECVDSFFLPGATNIRECSSFNTVIRTPWDTLNTNGGWTTFGMTSGDFQVYYELTDLCGNVTLDSTTLLLNNNVTAICPPDTTVLCDYYFDTLVNAVIIGNTAILEQLGTPTFPLNCSFGYTETDSLMVDGCGNGVVFRLMVSDGNTPQACLQEVQVEHVSNFDVIFPPDTSLCVSLDSADIGLPILSGVGCENVNFIAEDNIIPGTVPNCFVLERKWVVTNNCAFSGINSFDDTQLAERHFMDGGDGIIEYVQRIEVNDAPAPFFTEGCEIPDLYVPANSCEATIVVPTPMVNGCAQIDLLVAGSLGSNLGIQTSIGLGSHAVSYTATDNCGKTGTCTTFFEVIDTIPPALECNFQMVEIPVGSTEVTVFPSDLIQTGADNCGLVSFSFSSSFDLMDTTFLCCDEPGQKDLEIWARDEIGNISSCSTFIVLDIQAMCECDVFAVGRVATEENEGIANVEVNFASQTSSFNSSDSTDASGNYLKFIPAGNDFIITPSKNINPLNGVTTFDALLITKHILGSEPLDSPYKLIAADFNNSGSISTFDLLEMRKLILNISSEIPNNTSWRFVPSDFEFPNPENPFSSGWPEFIELNNIQADTLGLDFIGIKVGDVNNSADTQD